MDRGCGWSSDAADALDCCGRLSLPPCQLWRLSLTLFCQPRRRRGGRRRVFLVVRCSSPLPRIASPHLVCRAGDICAVSFCVLRGGGGCGGLPPPRHTRLFAGKCYSLGPNPRRFLVIRTTAGSMTGLTRQEKILLEHNLSTFQFFNNTECACVIV